MRITLQQFRLLNSIARHQTITRAAKEAGISQSSVSLHVKKLEQEVGEPLFERVNKKIFLTATGTAINDAAKDILVRYDRLETELEALKGVVAGELNIAVVGSAKYFMPHLIGEFVDLHPQVHPRLHVTDNAQVMRAIKDSRYDLYIVGKLPRQLNMQTLPIYHNILEVVAQPDHPLRDQESIPLALIAQENFISREADSSIRKAVDKIFAREKLKPHNMMELASSGAIKSAVLAGLGIAVLSRSTIEYELKAKALSILDVHRFPLHRRWFAAYPEGRRISGVARTFYDFLLLRMRANSPFGMTGT